jgi:hypothetical protein
MRGLCFVALLHSIAGDFLPPRPQEPVDMHTNLLLRELGDTRAQKDLLDVNSTGPPFLTVENNCGDTVQVWGLFGDGTYTDKIELGDGDTHVFSNDEIICGKHQRPCNSMAQVMYFKWAEDDKWDDTMFSEEFEFANFNNLQFNFDSQRSFSMPLGIAFLGVDGDPVPGCPEPNLNYCKAPENEGKCTSNAGKYDVCDFDATQCPDDKAWRVKTSLDTKKFYCISPDSELAVISSDMPDLTNEQCKHKIPGTTPVKDCHDLSCRDASKKAAIEQYFGGADKVDPDYTCLPWLNFPMPMEDQAAGKTNLLPLYMEVPKGSGNFVPVTQDVLRDPVGHSNNGSFVGQSLPQGSAKAYQTAVNRMCGHQPATQWAKWNGSPETDVEFFDPSGTPGTGSGDGKCGALTGQQQRAIPANGEKLLDHAMTYEGDEYQFWWNIKNEGVSPACPFTDLAPILKAGNAGIQCTASNKNQVVEVRIKTCPNGNPYK